jgi:pimeloyl-ACP methyl ester carboxylesterase
LRRVFPGQQFPVEFFDRFGAQFVPRWTNHGDETLDSYYRVLEHIGPVVLIAHSQGANLALEAAQRRPDLIRRVVVIEPAAAPKCDPADLSQATRVPHLFVWGDFCDKAPLWGDYRSVVEAYARDLRDAGGIADTLDLPVEGLSGNSHVPMMDRNSDQVAALVTRWIATNVRPMPPVDATPPMPRCGFP